MEGDNELFNSKLHGLPSQIFRVLFLEAWDSNVDFDVNICKIADTLQVWNREFFENVHKKKKELWARIGGIQKAMARRFSRCLLKLENKLWNELEDVLCQKELLWFQKSREDWIKSRERNTKQYHASTGAKKNHNHIAGLRELNGEWIEAGADLQDHVNGFFKRLFSDEGDCDVSLALKGWFPSIAESDLEDLNAPFKCEEVHKALFDMSPFKAPGPDGFHAAFY